MSEITVYYTTDAEIVARFAQELRTIPDHGLRPGDIRNFSLSFAGAIKRNKRYTSRQGISADLGIFNIGARVDAALAELRETTLTKTEWLHVLGSKPRLMPLSGKKNAENALFLATMLLDFPDVLAVPERRQEIRDRDSALRYVLSSSFTPLVGSKPETLEKYRRYAELVHNRQIEHTRFLGHNGQYLQSIGLMSAALLNQRLDDYDARQARGAAEKAVVTPAPEPKRPSGAIRDPQQSFASGFLTFRAKVKKCDAK